MILYLLKRGKMFHSFLLISFGTIKIFKFESYYSNSHSLKEIIMITKTYHTIITIRIDITQKISSTFNSDLYFAIF